MIIAIDGPAGSGKSSTAKALADALSGVYLDTGAMYRAMALALAESPGPLTDEAAADLVSDTCIDLALRGGELQVLLNGRDVTDEIRAPGVTHSASLVSQLPAVRSRLVSEQRRFARARSERGQAVVVEGRDIGTVVFPDADFKFFMDADPETRARRRHSELSNRGDRAELSEVLGDIVRRDRQDQEREHSPLRRASDAIVIDTTELTPAEQLALILDTIRAARHTERHEP